MLTFLVVREYLAFSVYHSSRVGKKIYINTKRWSWPWAWQIHPPNKLGHVREKPCLPSAPAPGTYKRTVHRGGFRIPFSPALATTKTKHKESFLMETVSKEPYRSALLTATWIIRRKTLNRSFWNNTREKLNVSKSPSPRVFLWTHQQESALANWSLSPTAQRSQSWRIPESDGRIMERFGGEINETNPTTVEKELSGSRAENYLDDRVLYRLFIGMSWMQWKELYSEWPES